MGPDNFKTLWQDKRFHLAVWNIDYFRYYAVPAEIIISLVIAVLLNQIKV